MATKKDIAVIVGSLRKESWNRKMALAIMGMTPETLAMEERGWDDSWSGLQALMAGKSAADAEKAFVTEMSKYAS